MKNVKQVFTVTIPYKQGYMNLTDDVMECVRRSNISSGICTISTMHTTASVFTSTNDTAEIEKYLQFYDKLTTLSEESVRPALKHQLAGTSVTLAIDGGELQLGLTQFITYMDFDGGREKTINVTIFGE